MPCGEDDCPICGQIKEDRQRHIENGEDPDSMESAMEDVGRNLEEALEMIKQDAESKGIDITNIDNIQQPPKPEEFSLYCKVEEWNELVNKIKNKAEARGEFWIDTEAAADLFWYANTLSAKTYRQLCNGWHIEQGDDYGEFDYKYTKYVLKECIKILKRALKNLADNWPREEEFSRLLAQLEKLESKILEI